MIQGVKTKVVQTYSDERGHFREILRDDEGFLERIEQVSTSLTNPGVIKAFHWHQNQNDFFYVTEGKILLGLYDPREDSSTRFEKLRIIISAEENLGILIPRRVLHGYKVLGDKPAEVTYLMDKKYNRANPDEMRVPHDDLSINFDWGVGSEAVKNG